MPNLTITIEDELMKQARIRVAQQGTSLSAKVRELLQSYVDGNDDASRRQREASTASLLQAIEAAASRAGTGNATPKSASRPSLRDDLYGAEFRASTRPGSAPDSGAAV